MHYLFPNEFYVQGFLLAYDLWMTETIMTNRWSLVLHNSIKLNDKVKITFFLTLKSVHSPFYLRLSEIPQGVWVFAEHLKYFPWVKKLWNAIITNDLPSFISVTGRQCNVRNCIVRYKWSVYWRISFLLLLGLYMVIYLICTHLGHSIFCLSEHKIDALKNP